MPHPLTRRSFLAVTAGAAACLVMANAYLYFVTDPVVETNSKRRFKLREPISKKIGEQCPNQPSAFVITVNAAIVGRKIQVHPERSLKMAKFLFVYRSSSDEPQKEPSPEQMQAIMAEWGAWFEKVGAAMVNGGDGLLPTGKIVRGSAVTDGPFIEAKELVGGFSILQADSYDQVVKHAKTCPVIKEGGSVEIRELAGFGESDAT